MELITIEENETIQDGYRKLIEAYENGISAKCEYDGYVITTGMIPANYKEMPLSDVHSKMKRLAVAAKIAITEHIRGLPYIEAPDLPDDEYYFIFENYSNTVEDSKVGSRKM